MATQTRKQSSAPRKRKPSRIVRENHENTTVNQPKRAKRSPFVHPDQIDLSPSPEPPASPPAAIKAPEDVSDVEYTLSTSVMLSGISIYADSMLTKLGQFNHRQCEIDTIKRLDKATEKSKTSFEWDTGTATLTAKGIAKARELTIVVEDGFGWLKVESFIERWMRDHKKDITVMLVFQYRKKSPVDVDSDDDENDVKKGRMVCFSARVTDSLMLVCDEETACETQTAGHCRQCTY